MNSFLIASYAASGLVARVIGRPTTIAVEPHSFAWAGVALSLIHIYYVFKSKKKHSIKQLLNYVNRNFAHDKVQIHFESNYIPDRVLIWANYNLKSQPLAKGSSRYFTKSDFDGSIPFAVISADTKSKVVTLQNNHYLKENNDYVTIIGELKRNNESQNGQAVYYLSTGINQPTAKESITNYKIVVDGLNKNEAKMCIRDRP